MPANTNFNIEQSSSSSVMASVTTDCIGAISNLSPATNLHLSKPNSIHSLDDEDQYHQIKNQQLTNNKDNSTVNINLDNIKNPSLFLKNNKMSLKTKNSLLNEDKNDIKEIEKTEINNNKNSESDTHSDNLRFQSFPNRDKHEKFLRDCFENILNLAVFNATDRQNKVIEWKNPEDLSKLIDFKLKQEADNDDELLKIINIIIKYSVKTGHPYFVNQLFSSVDPYALVGQWLTDALNPSAYTYEVAPVFILMEEEILKEMRKIVGFNDGIGDGIFCPGGSIANGFAISCARYKLLPEIKKRGLFSIQRLIIFTSEDAHYSVEKLATFMGIGSENVYKIKTNANGKMDVRHLEEEILRSINENSKPFMVSATSGTTVLGAFDPLHEIADICEKYKIWMHVDAAWGGGALMSKKYYHLLKGIHRADSVTWNPHKLLAAPQQCSTFLTKHEGILSDVHSTYASYLFQKDKFYNTKYDTGDKHIQCGRRVDVLKFWLMWRAKGTLGLENHINHVFKLSEYFAQNLKENCNFKLVIDKPECTNVCFWFIPPSLRDNYINNWENSTFKEKLHLVAPKIKERMMKNGTMMITYQPLKQYPNFFRLVIQNSGLNENDINYIIDEIQKLGNDL